MAFVGELALYGGAVTLRSQDRYGLLDRSGITVGSRPAAASLMLYGKRVSPRPGHL